MTEAQIADYHFMQYLNSGLLLLVSLLMGGLMWFFRKDIKENKDIVDKALMISNKNENDIKNAFQEIKHHRQDTDRVLKIIAYHTGANIG